MLNETFKYQPASTGGRLIQGEIICNLQEIRPNFAAAPASGEMGEFLPIAHPRVVVITPDCDLLSDYSTRSNPTSEASQNQGRLLDHIQLCDVFSAEEIRRNRNLNSQLWRQIRGNQNERYHALPAVTGLTSENTTHPEYFLDFKRMFTLPTEFLYHQIEVGSAYRFGIVPPVWLHQLIQRYFAFHSRIGVPDPADADR